MNTMVPGVAHQQCNMFTHRLLSLTSCLLNTSAFGIGQTVSGLVYKMTTHSYPCALTATLGALANL